MVSRSFDGSDLFILMRVTPRRTDAISRWLPRPATESRRRELWPGAESKYSRNYLFGIANSRSEEPGYPESYPGIFRYVSDPKAIVRV